MPFNSVRFFVSGACSRCRWTVDARQLIPGPKAEPAGGTSCQCPIAADDERPQGYPEVAPGVPHGDQTAAAGDAPQGEGPVGVKGAAIGGKKIQA